MPKHSRPKLDVEELTGKPQKRNKEENSDFCFISCDPETSMARLAVECGDYKHALSAYFETEEEAQADMAACEARGKRPWDVSSSEEAEDSTEESQQIKEEKRRLRWDLKVKKASEPETEANITAWQNSLIPRNGSWIVHMPILGISKLFQERKEAQLYIFRKMQEKIPGLKLSGGSIMGHEKEMGVTSRKHGMESYLKIAEYNPQPDEQYGTCIAFMRLHPEDDPWYFNLPLGYGPSENQNCNFTQWDYILYANCNWRIIFQEVFMMLEGEMGASRKEGEVVDKTNYKNRLLQQGEMNPKFKKLLFATAKEDLYYIDMFGLTRRAFLWEEVREQWNTGKENQFETKKVDEPTKFIDVRTGTMIGIRSDEFSQAEIGQMKDLCNLKMMREMSSVKWKCEHDKKKAIVTWEDYFQKLFHHYETEFGSQKFTWMELIEEPSKWFYRWLTYSLTWDSDTGKELRKKLKKFNVSIIISSEQGDLTHEINLGIPN